MFISEQYESSLNPAFSYEEMNGWWTARVITLGDFCKLYEMR
jgi:hypothetical protein